MIRYLILLSVLMMGACRKGDNSVDLFEAAQNLGKVSGKLKEASGIIASVSNPGMLWVINDSGNGANVFLIDQHGAIQLTCTIKAENRDWEDISIGPGPEDGKAYLYVGDIGDNKAGHNIKFVYRFLEPVADSSATRSINEVDTLTFEYPDGPRDAETLMIDPLSKDLFVISKREDSVRVYIAHYPFAKGLIRMETAAKLSISMVVAGNISANGHEILIKNYSKVFYWRRSDGQSIPETLKKKPLRLAYEPEHQGEAICWARDSTGYYTLSESSAIYKAQLKFSRRKK